MANRYVAYGLTIDSDVDLPELDRFEGAERFSADVVVRIGNLEGPIPASPLLREVRREADGGIYFAWAELGRMRIGANGSEIIVAPLADADMDWFSLALLGPVMAMLLHMRGWLVLHGSAVALPAGGALVFLGDNGAGKSTLAGAFVRAGYELVSDDVVAISTGGQRPCVQPAFPSMKLDRRLLDSFGPWPGEPLPPVPPGAAKQRLRLPSIPTGPVPLSHIFRLQRGADLDRPAAVPLRPAEALAMLMRYSYLPKLGAGMLEGEGGSAHFRGCATLAGTVPVSNLAVPDDLDRLLAAPADIVQRLADR